MKLSDKLDRIRKSTPKRSAFGQLYKAVKETRARHSRVTLYVLFISEEATHLLRNHVFQSSYPKTAQQWHRWFGQLVNDVDGSDTEPTTMQRLTYIHERSVLPGLALRTSKSWSVRSIIGWVGGAKRNAVFKPRNSAMARKRNKTSKKGKTRG